MPTKEQKMVARKRRSDAQRNRERILEVAKEASTRAGANTSLDDIASLVQFPSPAPTLSGFAR